MDKYTGVTIAPCIPCGTVIAPPSKSMAHRFLICAALADGESKIQNCGRSEDIDATLACLRAGGAKIRRDGDTATVGGCAFLTPPSDELRCGACGSTLRFLIPLCLHSGHPYRFTGAPRLFARPLGVYETICKEQNIKFEKTETSLTVAGILSPGRYRIPGNVSSQFISGLSFLLPLLENDSEIELTGSIESRPYVEMTLRALAAAGIEARWESNDRIAIPGNQRYRAFSAVTEGDWSNAAFWYAMNAVCDAQIRILGTDPDSLQGDKRCVFLFERLKKEKTPVIDVSDCPDLAPVLMASAAALNGALLTGTERLRLKESDRGAAMAEELSKFGVRTKIGVNEIHIEKTALHPPAAPLFGHDDHRIVMALAVLLLKTGGSLTGAQAVSKSYPDFFEELKKLNAEVRYES